jgi:hypothetical protein
MKFSRFLLFAVFVSILVYGPPATAQHTEHAEEMVAHATEDQTEEHAEEAAHEEHGEEHGGRHWHTNDVGIFLGATDEHGHDTELTWGLEYRRLIAKRWGLGVLFDYAGGELRNAILAPTLTWLPVGRLQILMAPGIEFHRGRAATEDCGCDPHGKSEDPEQIGLFDEDETYFVLRIGAGWNFAVGQNYAITPQINLDLVEGEKVWVYGLAFAYAW